MKYCMGDFGSTGPGPDADGAVTISSASTDLLTSGDVDLVKTVSDLAENSINSSLDKVSQIVKSQEIQNFIESNNLSPYLKDITKDRVKTVLALMGLWSVYRVIKSPVGLAAIAGGAFYVMTTNKPKVVDKMAIAAVTDETDTPNDIETELA